MVQKSTKSLFHVTCHIMLLLVLNDVMFRSVSTFARGSQAQVVPLVVDVPHPTDCDYSCMYIF